MAEFDFQVFCCDVDTAGEVFLDRLYEAGCGDATVFFKDGYVCLDFTREAENAESAVISAIKDFERAGTGGSVERVEPEDLASLSEIANRIGVTRASLQKYARGQSRIGKDFPSPVANIAGVRRELYSAAEVISWMHTKHRVAVSHDFLDLVQVIDTINRALIVKKARDDNAVQRIVSQLVAKEATEPRRV
jgi:transcriptional regulator with XRE-family HTH domain